MDMPQILIIDLGGQYTLLIGRRLRELGVRSVVLSPEYAKEWLGHNTPKGIILSGGWASIYSDEAPRIPETLLSLDVPVLGICLGMHWLARMFGGTVESSQEKREYGVTTLFRYTYAEGDPLFANLVSPGFVLQSHGDSVTVLPPGATMLGITPHCSFAAFRISEKRIWGVQFHPEAKESECGLRLLKNFLTICNAEIDWKAKDIVRSIQEEIESLIPEESPCIHLFSGGVDSTLAAVILKPRLGDRLICVTIDAGNFREGERKEIVQNATAVGCSLVWVDAKEEFLVALQGRVDAEEKRHAFQEVYKKKIEEIKREFGVACVIQGTLAPDLIESSKVGDASLIKTHHNAGVASLNPLGSFFKDEVRDLARYLELPEYITERMPFPGPGLFVRIVGVPVDEELLDLVRWADARVRDIVKEAGIEGDISQLIVALVGVPTTGVKGDQRRYAYAIVVRALQSADFMTGRGYELPSLVRKSILRTLTQHAQIVRVWFDETDKPPATFELE